MKLTIADGSWPPTNRNWFKEKEIMSKLGPLMTGVMPTTLDQQMVQQPKLEEKKEEIKPVKKEPEKPVEKDFYSVEIVSYPATSKIRIIKEFRAIVGLGLKEAKDKVEKVPFTAFEKLKKDEAEALVKKFEGYGAKMKLI